MAKTNETNEKETIKFDGKLKSAYNHVDKDDNGNVVKSTNIISIFRNEELECDASQPVDEYFDSFYEGKFKKWIPDWYKENKDFFTVKSAYNIPVMIDEEKKQMSFAEFVERGNIRDAHVVLKCNVKDNAIYPNAMLVLEEGKPYDAFENF